MNPVAKNVCFLIILLCIFSCSTSRKTVDLQLYTDFEIIEFPLVFEKDTITLSELRFYKIQSALDAMKLMYLNYGDWSKKSQGRYQENTNQIVWNNVNLLNNNEAFTVIANGTETLNESFASLIVLDSKNVDCLNASYPLKEKLTKLFTSKMNVLDKKSHIYKLFRR